MPGLSTENPGAPCLRSRGSVVDASFSLCASDSEGSALTNGGLSLHSPMKRKLEAEKDYVFDKRLRYSVRQNESNCRFRDIVVRKEEGFTHILLSSQTSDNNALTPEVRAAVGGWAGWGRHSILVGTGGACHRVGSAGHGQGVATHQAGVARCTQYPQGGPGSGMEWVVL